MFETEIDYNPDVTEAVAILKEYFDLISFADKVFLDNSEEREFVKENIIRQTKAVEKEIVAHITELINQQKDSNEELSG
jgi:ribosomal protein S17E